MASNYRDSSQTDWSAAEQKDFDRYNLSELMFLQCRLNLPKKTPIEVLSLPADRWIFEKELAKLFHNRNISFWGIEKNKRVFTIAKRIGARITGKYGKAKFKMANPIPMEVGDYLSIGPSRKFNIVYLDWMGCISSPKIEEVNLLFEKDMFQDTSLFAFTLMRRREQKVTIENLQKEVNPRIKVDLGCNNLIGIQKQELFVSYIATKASKHDYSLEVIDTNPYRGVEGSPQLTILTKLTRDGAG